MRSKGITDRHFDAAPLVDNVLCGPREVLDLQFAGMASDEIKARLTRPYRAALHA